MKKSLSPQIRTGLKVLLFLMLFPVVAYAGPSIVEKMITLPFEGLVKAIKDLGFKTYDQLIFNSKLTATAPFTNDEWKILMTWYSYIRNATMGLLVISTSVAGYRIMHAGANPRRRSDVMQKIMYTLYAFAIVLFLPYFMQIVFLANNALVEMFKGLAKHYGVDFTKIGFSFLDSIKTDSLLGTVFVKLGYCGLMVYFNFLYTMRKFVLMSMFVAAPLAAWGFSISGKDEPIGVVAGEIVSNAFMQAAHALVLSLYLVIIGKNVSTDFSIWWAQIFGMMALIPTAKAIRNLFQGWLSYLGVNEEASAGLATAALGGAAAIAKSIGGSFKTGGVKLDGTAAAIASSLGGNMNSGSGGSAFGNAGSSSPFGGTTMSQQGMNISQLANGRSPGAADGAMFSSGGKSPVNDAYSKVISMGQKIGGKAGSFAKAAGTVAGAAMGLPMGTTGINSFSQLAGGLSGMAVGGASKLGGTLYGIGSSVHNYPYATDDPYKEYVDPETGEGLIKGVEDANGQMKYYMPHHEGYNDVEATALFKTESEAVKAGYSPVQKAPVRERVAKQMDAKDAFAGTFKAAGTVIMSPFGSKAAQIGGKTFEYMGYGVEAPYIWVRNKLARNPDKFRWN